MKVLGGACVLVAVTVAVAVSACGGSHRAPSAVTGARVAARRVSSSRLILGGRVRCTAVATTPVAAGQPLGVSFSFRNVSNDAVKVRLAPWDVSLVLRAPDGTKFDTRRLVPPTIPYIPPRTLRAGVTKTVAGLGSTVRVRWRGPLRIAPSCGKARLPALRLAVTAPGPPPNERTAVADVVAATGHLLDRCRPQKPGVAVEGKIDPPSGSGPSMSARCSIRLHSEGRFVVAQVLVVMPPGRRGVRVLQPYDTVSLRDARRPYQVIAWELVVTKSGAVTVGGFTQEATRAANRMAPEWLWSGSGWGRPGSGRCGGEGVYAGPSIDLISVCR